MRMPWMNQNPAYARYTIGRGTYGNPKIEDFGKRATLTIGSFCSFASGVRILLSGEHHTDWVTTSPVYGYFGDRHMSLAQSQNRSKGNVSIGSDVWVGMDATILSGVTIGAGAVIGACSVVTRDVKPYMIAAGNPAKAVRWRFHRHLSYDYDLIQRLLRVSWWDWPDEKIREFMPLLLSDRVEEFLEKAERCQ